MLGWGGSQQERRGGRSERPRARRKRDPTATRGTASLGREPKDRARSDIREPPAARPGALLCRRNLRCDVSRRFCCRGESPAAEAPHGLVGGTRPGLGRQALHVSLVSYRSTGPRLDAPFSADSPDGLPNAFVTARQRQKPEPEAPGPAQHGKPLAPPCV